MRIGFCVTLHFLSAPVYADVPIRLPIDFCKWMIMRQIEVARSSDSHCLFATIANWVCFIRRIGRTMIVPPDWIPIVRNWAGVLELHTRHYQPIQAWQQVRRRRGDRDFLDTEAATQSHSEFRLMPLMVSEWRQWLCILRLSLRDHAYAGKVADATSRKL